MQGKVQFHTAILQPHTAIDRQHLPRHIGGIVTGQEQRSLGNFLRLTQSAQHGELGKLVQQFLRDGLEDVGHHIAGGDGVHPDGHTLAGEFLGPGLGQANDTGLGGGIVGLSDVAEFSDHGGNADDAAVKNGTGFGAIWHV